MFILIAASQERLISGSETVRKRTPDNGARESPSVKRQQLGRLRSAPRASQACQACASSKTRCDNEPTCRRCQRKNILCIRTVLDLTDVSNPAQLREDYDLATLEPQLPIMAAHTNQRAPTQEREVTVPPLPDQDNLGLDFSSGEHPSTLERRPPTDRYVRLSWCG